MATNLRATAVAAGNGRLDEHIANCKDLNCSVRLADALAKELDRTPLTSDEVTSAVMGLLLERLLRLNGAQEKQIEFAMLMCAVGQKLAYIAMNADKVAVVGDEEGIKVYEFGLDRTDWSH